VHHFGVHLITLHLPSGFFIALKLESYASTVWVVQLLVRATGVLEIGEEALAVAV
jgi:hypothetical protein